MLNITIFSTATTHIKVVRLYLLIQYLWFQLPAVYRGPKQNWKIEETNGS
jgi:hypothetical protein